MKTLLIAVCTQHQDGEGKKGNWATDWKERSHLLFLLSHTLTLTVCSQSTADVTATSVSNASTLGLDNTAESAAVEEPENLMITSRTIT